MTATGRKSAARTVDVLVIGAGHAGLAVSCCLLEHGIDHVVLERGEIANSWRRERWDSLTLLTPNWQSRLPGYSYSGDDPDGYMTMPEVIEFISDYAGAISAPVRTGTTVTRLGRSRDGYDVDTDAGRWRCRSVVIASGACNLPTIPSCAADLPDGIASVTPFDYRGPDSLEPGGVLVVGASATGVQLADEIHRSGRPVTVATGEHVRMPRRYRGRDVQWWLDAAGILDETYQDVEDINRARRLPSPQLVGSREHEALDLNYLSDRGVRIVGRLMGVRDGSAQFSGSLRNVCALADLKLGRLLDSFDEWAAANPATSDLPPPTRYAATRVDETPRLTMNLQQEKIRTVLWATGFRPDYSWLDVPVLDRKGRIRHDGGVTAADGLFVTGLPVLRKRKSSFIHGAEDDARYISSRLAAYLRVGNSAAATG